MPFPWGKKAEEYKVGCDLDEFWSHKLLETHGQTLTVVALRKVLKEIDLDNNNRMSMVEFMLYHFNHDVRTLLSRPQGTNEELVIANAALKKIQAIIAEEEALRSRLSEAAAQGGVKGNAAGNELKQLDAAPKTALNKEILTAEAAVRKAQKATGIQPQGALWWVERSIMEAKKYKSKAQGGIAKS